MKATLAVTALGAIDWENNLRRYIGQGFKIQHYSTCCLADGRIAHSAIFVRES